VKRIGGFILLLIFLNANTAFGEIMRLPVLIRHYLEHREQEQLSFSQFWTSHYSRIITHTDGQHKEHENLPFKSFCTAVTELANLCSEENWIIAIQWPEPPDSRRNFIVHPIRTRGYEHHIWQPPRLV